MTRLEDGDVLSPYDDLSFLMYTDSEVRWTDNQPTNQPINHFNDFLPQVAQLIAKLEKKKLEAVATERFEYAKKIKSAIGEEISRYHDIFAMSYPHRLRRATH